MNSYIKGLFYESLSVLLLIIKRYQIIKRRYRCKLGEVDIIAKKNNTIIFIEVKYRHQSDMAIEAVARRHNQQTNMYNSIWLYQYSQYTPRIDVIIWYKLFMFIHYIGVAEH